MRTLGAVYAAESADEVARTYDAWAETYDAEMAALGYRHPASASRCSPATFRPAARCSTPAPAPASSASG